jgi:pimeloyl-ACP methyl ester carboxylesterase
MQNKSGRRWLLLRGLSREAGHWGGFIAQMQAAMPTARISTLDLPGAGRYHSQASPCSIAEITAIVRQQALQQGLLAEPITILGLSLGGMVTWEWLLNYPEDIESAVLVNTSFSNLSPFYQRMRWQSYGAFIRLLLHTDIYRRELAILQLVCNLRDWDESRALEWLKIQTERPVSLNNSLKQIIAAARYKPGPEKPKQPVLLINSRGDRLVAPACSEAIHIKWRMELHTHPWAGHDLSLDDGIWLANRLKFWSDAQAMPAI